MRAMAIQDAYGLDNIKPLDKAQPEPGPGEVLLKMKSASLNFRDFLISQDLYGGAFPLPLVPLSDGCGEVAAVGEGVTRVAVGDRVAPCFFQKWYAGEPTLEGLSSSMGGPLDGCAQEYRVLSEQGVVKMPDYLSDHQVASLPCAALTAWRSLVVEAQVKTGDKVLIQGTGGVSIFGLQFAKAAGAEVIVTSSSDEKLERAKGLGADHLINYREHPEWAKEVRKVTGGAGVDHIVEVGGGNTLKQSMKCIRIGGHISVIGVLSGPKEALQIGAMIATSVTLKGISVGSRTMFEDMVKAMTLHRIEPVVDQVFPLEELPQALQTMGKGGHFGKICLDIPG
jgi:NADPH:quinone reductase-like Zn-dependent oxidoreductase